MRYGVLSATAEVEDVQRLRASKTDVELTSQ